MSIGLLITVQDPDLEDQLVPIASEAVYIRYWKTTALALKQRWIPRLQTGWVVSQADIAPMRLELDQLRRHLLESQADAEIIHHVIVRISQLSRELANLPHRHDCQAYVGPLGQPFMRRVPSSPLKILWTKPVPPIFSDSH